MITLSIQDIPNLYMVETIDSLEAAQKLDRVWPKSSQKREPLKIMIQVNTSGENRIRMFNNLILLI